MSIELLIPAPVKFIMNPTQAQPESGGGSGGGVTDHGDLNGLGDDDHLQYHNNTRGDARYSLIAHNHNSTYDTIGAAAAAQAAAIQRANHTGSQAISTVTGLQTALDSKAETSHNHDAAYAGIGHDHDTDYDALGAAAAAQAAAIQRANHTGSQAISTVTGLQTALDSKADSPHDHDTDYDAIGAAAAAQAHSIQRANHTGSQAISTVTGLQTALDSVDTRLDDLEAAPGGGGVSWEADPTSATYGAVGDGVTDDSDAVQAAIDTGKAIILPPGKTFLISKPLTLEPNQTMVWLGDALLKRADQVITTTSTTVTASSTTQVTVASVTGFSVGQGIVLRNGSTYSRSRIISDITGSVITVSEAFDVSVSGSTTVCHGYALLSAPSRNRLRNPRIDGNKANWTHARWETTSDIVLVDKECRVEGGEIYDSPGESIVAFGDNHTIDKIVIYDGNGNGVHWSGGDGSILSNATIRGMNLDTSIGHVDGCVSWSNDCGFIKIINNWFEGGLTGCGAMSERSDSRVEISGNTFKDHTNYGIHMSGASGTSAAADSIISNNTFHGSPTAIYLNQTNSVTGDDGWISRVSITGNAIITPTTYGIQMFRCRDCTVTGNTFDVRGATQDGIYLAYCDTNQIISNTVDGGNVSVRLGNSTARTTVAHNALRNSVLYGVYADSTSGESNVAESNRLTHALAANNAWQGVTCSPKLAAINNVLTLDAATGGQTALDGIVISSTPYTTTTLGPGAVCIGNTVVGNCRYGIRAPGGSGKAIIRDNQVTASTILSNGGGIHTGDAAVATYTGTSSGSLQTGAGLVTISSGGSGYSGTITVFFTQPGMNTVGNFAYGTATIVNGAVSAVSITSGGSGYTVGPTVTVHFCGNDQQGNIIQGTGALETASDRRKALAIPEQVRNVLTTDLVQSHVGGTYQTIMSVTLPVGIHNLKSIVPHTRGSAAAVYNRLIAGTATLAGAVGDGLGFGLIEGAVASLVTVAATGTWTTSAPARSSAAAGACHILDVTIEVLTAGTVLLQGNINATANMTWERGANVIVTQIA